MRRQLDRYSATDYIMAGYNNGDIVEPKKRLCEFSIYVQHSGIN